MFSVCGNYYLPQVKKPKGEERKQRQWQKNIIRRDVMNSAAPTVCITYIITKAWTLYFSYTSQCSAWFLTVYDRHQVPEVGHSDKKSELPLIDSTKQSLLSNTVVEDVTRIPRFVVLELVVPSTVMRCVQQ